MAPAADDDARTWSGTFEVAAGSDGVADVSLAAGGADVARRVRGACALRLADGARVPLDVDGAALRGFAVATERGAWRKLEERWGGVFGAAAPGPLVEARLEVCRVPDGAPVVVVGRAIEGWPADRGYRDGGPRPLERIVVSRIAASGVDATAPDVDAAPAPAAPPRRREPVDDPVAGVPAARIAWLVMIAAVAALVVRTGWLWTRAPRVAAVHATFGVLVAAVAALGVILWTHAFGLRSVAQRRQDDWLPTFVEAGVEVASPLRTWPLVVCLIVVALAMVFGQDAAGMIARTGDLQAHNVDDYGRPGTSAIDMLRATTVLTAIAVGCLALTTWLSRLGQARRLRALLLARPDAPAGGWQLLDGTVASSRGDGPPARHVRGTELDSKGRGLWGNERAQSQAFVLHAGGEAIQIEDGATWASAFASGRPVELETKVGSYYEDILEVPTGARVLLAGRVDRGGDVPTVRHTGTGSIVMFATAAGGAGLAGLRRRLRVHAATPWIALAMVAGIVIAAAVGR